MLRKVRQHWARKSPACTVAPFSSTDAVPEMRSSAVPLPSGMRRPREKADGVG